MRIGTKPNFTAIREAKGLTMIQFAVAADVSETLVRRIERGGGTPRHSIRRKLAAAYGVNITDIPAESDHEAEHTPAA